jgi:prepilin-type N-terminal cleavage/methylation domain-containing protein
MFKILLKRKKGKKKAFTMVELIVVILIIGTLLTLGLLSLDSARQKARDGKRISDVKQIQFGLESYYRDNGEYPESIEEAIVYNDVIYLAKTPAAPSPPDGDCDTENNFYSYQVNHPQKDSYSLYFCLGGKAFDLNPGIKRAMPGGIFDSLYSISGQVLYHNSSSPVPMSDVTVYLKKNGQNVYTAKTSVLGEYEFPLVFPGVYEVYFSLETSAGGAVNAIDAGQLGAWVAGSLPFGGLRVLAGDVYANSPDVIITDSGNPDVSSDVTGVNDFFLTGGYPNGTFYKPAFTPVEFQYNPPGWFVFTKEDNLNTSYSQFPIPYANGGPSTGYSSMTIEVSNSDIDQNFYSLTYGDINQSFIPN